MKELQENIIDQVHNVREAEFPKETLHIGKLHLQKGMLLWEFDLNTAEVKPAAMDGELVYCAGEIRRKHTARPMCLYVAAINKKNAEKKFLKMVDQQCK